MIGVAVLGLLVVFVVLVIQDFPSTPESCEYQVELKEDEVLPVLSRSCCGRSLVGQVTIYSFLSIVTVTLLLVILCEFIHVKSTIIADSATLIVLLTIIKIITNFFTVIIVAQFFAIVLLRCIDVV